jgi:Xaa-Pro aminopeptidase
MPIKKLQSIAIEELTYGLVELGVLSGKVSALIEKKAFEPYFPHGIGHSLGLDVHDITPDPFILAPGTVVTLEPGLYFNKHTAKGSGAKRYLGIGIRLENDILMTSKGAENLSEDIPFL